MDKMIKLLALVLLVTLLLSGCRSLPVSPDGANTTVPTTETTPPSANTTSSTPTTEPTSAPTTPTSSTPTVSQPPTTPTAVRGNQVGNLAFDFQVQDLNGQTVSLADLRGKPVLINFWATWCPPCRYEMPFLQEIYDSWSAKGLVLYAIDYAESSATIKKYLTDNNLSMPVLLDLDGKVTRTYGIASIPTTFLIDENGVIQYKKIGAFSGKAEIEQSLSKIIP